MTRFSQRTTRAGLRPARECGWRRGVRLWLIPLLAQISGVPVVKAENLVEATQDTGSFVQ